MGVETSRFSPKLANNPRAYAAKVQIRVNVFAAMRGGSVFDGFAGAGEMYSSVWNGANGYTGCDLKWQRDDRRMFCADNRRVMRAIDLRQFNVFDFDAFGSPWEQAMILADRRRVDAGEMLGVVLTEGSGLSLKVNNLPVALRILTGIKSGAVGMSRQQGNIIDRAIAGIAKRMRCDVVRRWEAQGKTGASMRYIGLVLRGRT